MEQASRFAADLFDDEPTQQRSKLPTVAKSLELAEIELDSDDLEQENPPTGTTQAL